MIEGGSRSLAGILVVRVPLDMHVQEKYFGEVQSSLRQEKCEAKAKRSKVSGERQPGQSNSRKG